MGLCFYTRLKGLKRGHESLKICMRFLMLTENVLLFEYWFQILMNVRSVSLYTFLSRLTCEGWIYVLLLTLFLRKFKC